MSGRIALQIACTVALIAGGSGAASAWGWWNSCDGPYCLGPPYGNIERPQVYIYDHQRGPTWTGNGWAYLPVGTYRPLPPEHGPILPPGTREDDHRGGLGHRHRHW